MLKFLFCCIGLNLHDIRANSRPTQLNQMKKKKMVLLYILRKCIYLPNMKLKLNKTKKLFNHSIHHSSKFIYIKVLYKFSSLPFSLYTNLQFHQNTKSQVLYNNARVHTDLYKSSTIQQKQDHLKLYSPIHVL